MLCCAGHIAKVVGISDRVDRTPSSIKLDWIDVICQAPVNRRPSGIAAFLYFSGVFNAQSKVLTALKTRGIPISLNSCVACCERMTGAVHSNNTCTRDNLVSMSHTVTVLFNDPASMHQLTLKSARRNMRA